MFQMRTATACVGDDGIELVGWKLIDLPAGQVLRQFPFAIMRMERAAAGLVGRRNNFATIMRQHLGSIAIDVTVDEILRATGKQRDAVTPFAARRNEWRDQVGGKGRLNLRSHGFEFAQPHRQQFQNAAAPNEYLNPELLIEAQD